MITVMTTNKDKEPRKTTIYYINQPKWEWVDVHNNIVSFQLYSFPMRKYVKILSSCFSLSDNGRQMTASLKPVLLIIRDPISTVHTLVAASQAGISLENYFKFLATHNTL